MMLRKWGKRVGGLWEPLLLLFGGWGVLVCVPIVTSFGPESYNDGDAN